MLGEISGAGDTGYACWLAVANGKPAISHYDWGNGDLQFTIPKLD